MNKRVIIIGAGPGGLAAAMLLASRGFAVQVFEQEMAVGGRSGGLRLGDYRFDLGSTMLMMPFVFEEIFELSGARLQDEVELIPVEPMYRLDFCSRALDMFVDEGRMRAELARFSPGAEAGLAPFLEKERERLEHLYPVLQRSWPSIASMVSPMVLRALPYIGWDRSLYGTASEYFDDDDLRLAFSFQSAYLGMSPWHCPGGFAMVPYVEHAFGLFHVRGGIRALCEAMARVAIRRGARIECGQRVTRLEVEKDACTGVELNHGRFVDADAVVINADATRALLELLDHDVSLRFHRHHLEHLHESCSTFMLYLGLDTQLPLGHHTFFFARDYRGEMDRVFQTGQLDDDLSVYVCNPAASDPTMAPPGHSAVYALSLVPNTRFPIDWRREEAPMRRRMLDRIQRSLGEELEPHIQVEKVLTPEEWQTRFSISHGAVFGPTHSMDQLLAFRLPNRLPHPKNLFLTGGGTNPGSGLPTIVESGRIAARLLCEDSGVDFPASRSLPEDGRAGGTSALKSSASR